MASKEEQESKGGKQQIKTGKNSKTVSNRDAFSHSCTPLKLELPSYPPNDSSVVMVFTLRWLNPFKVVE